MEEKELEKLTINELKELAESEGIEITTTKKTDIIEEINKAREVDTIDNTEKNQDNTDNASGEMSNEDNANEENNSNDKADKDSTDIEIPKGFVKKTNLNKKEYGYYNGRKYKKMKNGYGMWADNGQSFLLSELK